MPIDSVGTALIFSSFSPPLILHKAGNKPPTARAMEATVVVVDNSEWTRNGDYAPTRFQVRKHSFDVFFFEVALLHGVLLFLFLFSSFSSRVALPPLYFASVTSRLYPLSGLR
jgi:hypothetical protein